MTVRLRAGGASDVGQHRANNQDSMLVGERVFVVADGMGGHQGGEVASAIAVDRIGRLAPSGDTTTDELVGLVREANDAVFTRSSEDPSLSGMGTTVVATAVVVEDGEERVAIVNVGDSRAYRLTNGHLEQVSEDHSLVGEMVRDGRLSSEQAHDHPQKNIVTRAIGIEPAVEVDEFQLLPHAGDRYLLCSDGLTDEVSEEEIASVLRTIDDPEQAATDLVRRANENGGRDNVTVVIVDVVDDGGAARAASSAVPDAAEFSHDAGSDTDMLLALPDDMAHARGSGASRPDDAPEPRARRQRAVTARSVAFVVIVLALVGGGVFLSYRSARDYHFAEQGGEVTIVRGGWLWLYDDEVAERTGIEVDDLDGQSRIRVDEQRDFATLDEARSAAENLTTTTTTTTTTTSTTTTTGGPTTTTGA